MVTVALGVTRAGGKLAVHNIGARLISCEFGQSGPFVPFQRLCLGILFTGAVRYRYRDAHRGPTFGSHMP